LLGVDLFNHGYYWEAHEAWEAVWNAAGRRGPVASFLKGLIQLAVVGVKVRQRIPGSAVAHARRAAELFREVEAPTVLGLSPAEMATWAERIADRPPDVEADLRPVEVLFPFALEPQDSGGQER
jgi:hypothetical protein